MSRKTRRAMRQQAVTANEAMAYANRRISEAIQSLTANYVDPNDAMVDPNTGEYWTPLLTGGTDAWEKNGLPTTEEELTTVRRQARYLAATNPYCICGLQNRVSYIVGSGHTYDVDAGDDEALAERVLAGVALFLEVNRWHARQQEVQHRLDRDGECFLRVFPGDGTVRVRFIEPSQVATPRAQAMVAADSFGIRTDPDDVETVLGYWIDGELVPAEQIQHRKANVDGNVKRGHPLFYPVRHNLLRASKLLRNMGVVADVQSAIALIRKHQGASSTSIASFVSGAADAEVLNTDTGQTTYHKRYAPGTILDAPATIEYDFPAQGIDASRYVAVLQAELRAIASLLVMPEFMLTSDASNANYSSTMVAEGPAVKNFQRLQFAMIEDDLALIRMALQAGGIDAEAVTITATSPNIQTRDRLADVQADRILVDTRAMSIQTMAERNDLDWQTEQPRIEEEDAAARERFNPMAGLTAGPADDDEDVDQGEFTASGE